MIPTPRVLRILFGRVAENLPGIYEVTGERGGRGGEPQPPPIPPHSRVCRTMSLLPDAAPCLLLTKSAWQVLRRSKAKRKWINICTQMHVRASVWDLESCQALVVLLPNPKSTQSIKQSTKSQQIWNLFLLLNSLMDRVGQFCSGRAVGDVLLMCLLNEALWHVEFC